MSEAGNLVETLSAAEISAIEAEAAHLPDRPSAAIESLRIVQEHRGWVSDESLHAVARLLGMSAEALDSIATFYNLIFRKPVGRHVIMTCNSVSCYVMGCDRISSALCAHLGISHGETTHDNRFTLLPIVCLGACDRAPVMTVDEELFGNLSTESLPGILEQFP